MNRVFGVFGLIFVCLMFGAGCFNYVEPEVFFVEYVVVEGGFIDGEDRQVVNEGEDGFEVSACNYDGYKFVSWSDGNVNPTRQEKNVVKNLTFTAYFEPEVKVESFTVKYLKSEGGMIEGDVLQQINYGESSLTVTAKPYNGYKFKGWSDGVKKESRSDLITDNVTFTAYFEILSFSVKYVADHHGVIEGEKNQIVNYGADSLSVEAVPDTGYVFKEWSDNLNTNPVRKETIVIQNVFAVAKFTRQSFDVKYSTNGFGIIEGETEQSIFYGEHGSEITAKPNIGYRFKCWSDNESTHPTRRDINVKNNISAVAIFEKQAFAVSYLTDGNGTIEGISSQTVKYQENSQTVTAKPNTGYKFKEWSDGLKTESRTDLITSNTSFMACFEKLSYWVVYTYDGNGTIEGETEQIIKYNESSQTVRAIPNDGYRLKEWSDGLKTESRTDLIVDNTSFTAYFEMCFETFTYEYNGADSNNNQADVFLKHDILNQAVFPIPTKQNYNFRGWYLESECIYQVADKDGNLTATSEEIFSSNSNKLYAKWSRADGIIYPVLMVYVTESKATLRETGGEYLDFYYKMNSLERKICLLITYMMEKTLNEMFDGLVTFELDNYFTTKPIDESSFSSGLSFGKYICYDVFANDIMEVGHLLGKYKSIMTTFCLNDTDFKVLHSGAIAGIKYASMNLESFLLHAIVNESQRNAILDFSDTSWWHWTMIHYLHEFAHTVEMASKAYEFHAVISYYWNQISQLETTKLYLLNQAQIGDKTVGIPFAFWNGEMDVSVNYVPNTVEFLSPGKVVRVGDENNPKEYVTTKVPYGSEMEVEAIPYKGYKFSHWSDGVTTPRRKDTNIISYLTVKAIFIKDE